MTKPGQRSPHRTSRPNEATVRGGWNGKIGALPLQLWTGVGDWDTGTTVTGHVNLEGVGQLNYEADQKPRWPLIYDFGTNLQFTKKLQPILDVGFDFHGGFVVVAGPTYRF